jgi:type IV pilus assembly protein PilB
MGERRLLGEMLVEAGLIRKSDLDLALGEQRARGGRLCYHLMRLGRVTPGSLFLFLQDHFGILSPEWMRILTEGPVPDLIPPRLAHFYQMVPLQKTGDTLVLALSSVDNPNLIPAVEELTGLKVDPLITPPSLIREALERFYPPESEAGVIREAVGDNVLVLSDPGEGLPARDPEEIPSTAPGAEWIRALLGEAIRRRCREILLEPREDATAVHYRSREGSETSRILAPSVATSVAVALEDLSKMVARGRTVPREGRFRLRQKGRRIAVLVSSVPGLAGESYHLRIVEERVRRQTLEEMLEDYPEARSGLERALEESAGLLLVAAPEGHRREEIVAACVASIRWKTGRATFLGDPGSTALTGVEVREGRSKGDSTFAERLAALQEQKWDLVAVDRVETPAELAAVLRLAEDALAIAGVRQPDAFQAFDWLCRSGGTDAIRAGRLRGIVGVRMVERVCEHCRRRYELLEEFPHLTPRRNGGGNYFANTGCRVCRGAGLLDLEAAFEFLPGLASLGTVRVGPRTQRDLRRELSQAGMKTLFASLMDRAAAGEVDVREPLRLLYDEGRGAA